MDKLKKFLIRYWPLLLIFLLALSLRLYRIDQNIPPLYNDEVGGPLAYSAILAQSHSIGSYLQHFFFSFAWLYGNTPFGVRFPSALYGSFFTIAIFALAFKISKNKHIALVSSLFSAILPWQFMLSRIGHISITLMIIFITLHFASFIKANKTREYIYSLIPLFIAVYLYPSLTVLGPIGMVLVFIYIYKSLPASRRLRIGGIGAFIALLLFIILSARFNLLSLSGRGLDLAIWRDVNTTFDTNHFRGLSWNTSPTIFSFGLPPAQLADKLFLNTATANLSIFAKNYFSFFSPDWLFLHGDPILRHSTGLMGEFYPFLAPFLIYGAYKFFQTEKKKTKVLFLVWILASPIPAAITKDGAGYLLRVVTMMPLLTYFCAFGLVESFKLIKPKWKVTYGVSVGVIALYSIWYFFFGYFNIYPTIAGHAFEAGFKELSDFQVAHQEKTMLILWDGYYPYTQFLFWQNIPVKDYEKLKITPIGIGQTTFWKTLPDLYFANPMQNIDVANFIDRYHPTYIVFPDRYFVKWSGDLLTLTDKKVDQIDYLDKTTAFTVYTLRYPVLINAMNSN